MKNPSAPPRAPRFTKRRTSTQSFISFGVGRASLSIKKVSNMRVSLRSHHDQCSCEHEDVDSSQMPMWLSTQAVNVFSCIYPAVVTSEATHKCPLPKCEYISTIHARDEQIDSLHSA